MGLLYGEKLGVYSYKETKKYQKILKRNAVLQLVKLLQKFGDFEKNKEDALKFGTETEIHVLKKKILDKQKIYSVHENLYEIINDLKEKKKLKNSKKLDFQLVEEFSSWMLEILPEKPFEDYLNIKKIHEHFNSAEKYLRKNKNLTILFGMSTLPTIGTELYLIKPNNRIIKLENRKTLNKYSESDYFLDSTITNHSRFKNLVNNTKKRKGKKSKITIPLYQDSKTVKKAFNRDHFGFGMANTCIQITYSTKNMKEARFLYDQLHVISPFMMSVSVSSPVFSGRLTDWDCRWKIIEQSVDDRNFREIGRIEKSKFSPINFFISNDERNKGRYNDRRFTLNLRFRKMLRNLLRERGCAFFNDERLLNHFAYLFVREFLIIFPELVEVDCDKTTKDFEAIQSTNWNDVRFKPPPSFDSKLGWLVEFRPMDSPITNKEKTAMIFFVTLLQRIILDHKLGVNFYIPISKCDKNFEDAVKRDSILKSKFIFRRYFSEKLHGDKVKEDDLVEITFLEFLEGKENFSGIKLLIKKFIELNQDFLINESNKIGYSIIDKIWDVYNFLAARGKGKLMTSAAYIRNFVMKHKDYKHDSNLSNKIMTDLIDKVVCLQKKNSSKRLIGNFLNF